MLVQEGSILLPFYGKAGCLSIEYMLCFVLHKICRQLHYLS